MPTLTVETFERLRMSPGQESRYQIGERELHCGNTFELGIEFPGRPMGWIPVRIEHCRDHFGKPSWYLVAPFGFIYCFAGAPARLYP